MDHREQIFAQRERVFEIERRRRFIETNRELFPDRVADLLSFDEHAEYAGDIGPYDKTKSDRTCDICLDTVDDGHRSPCGHYWCRPCIIERFESAAKRMHMFPARCCQSPIVPDNHALIKPETWDRYFKTKARYLEKKEEVKTPNPTFCSKRECSKFIPLEKIDKGRAMCVCGHVTCADCKAEYHTGECVVDAATEHFLNLARKEHWQKCPHCGAMTERIDGCNDMSMFNLPILCRGFCFETFTDNILHRLQPMPSQVLLCVWQGVEDMYL